MKDVSGGFTLKRLLFDYKIKMVRLKSWRKQHKWLGLIISFFLVAFCLSGIVLNHRSLVGTLNVNRKLLPPNYHFKDWNNGFLRGTLACKLNGQDKILLYGAEGCWLTDSLASSFVDFNSGLPQGCDLRSLRSMVQMPDGTIVAANQFGIYHLDETTDQWQLLRLPLSENERISDMTTYGDTLLVTGRSYLYLSRPPYNHFQKLELKASDVYDGKVSLFRTVWQLHSGELFGSVGRFVLDLLALCLLVICISGWLYWLLPKKRASWRLYCLWLHDRLGTKTIILTLLIALTGWCLRPPVLIGLVQGRIPALPGTSLYSSNPWHDNLRMLRYDDDKREWLLSASDGFYRLKTLSAIPEKIKVSPPVSVMGLNVWQKAKEGYWLVGSFSGIYCWERKTNRITDYTTGKPVMEKSGPPFGKLPVSGFTSDFFGHKKVVVNYETGSDFAEMPASFSTLPMSLWDFALEVHSGRIYVFGNLASMVFIFFAGILAMWALWTGYRIRLRKLKIKFRK